MSAGARWVLSILVPVLVSGAVVVGLVAYRAVRPYPPPSISEGIDLIVVSEPSSPLPVRRKGFRIVDSTTIDEMVGTIENSRPDAVPYDIAMSIRIELYAGEQCWHAMSFASGLFYLDERQYRDESVLLERVIDGMFDRGAAIVGSASIPKRTYRLKESFRVCYTVRNAGEPDITVPEHTSMELKWAGTDPKGRSVQNSFAELRAGKRLRLKAGKAIVLKTGQSQAYEIAGWPGVMGKGRFRLSILFPSTRVTKKAGMSVVLPPACRDFATVTVR